MGEERKVYKVLVGKPEGKRPLGRQKRRWEDGIRMDLRKIGCGLSGFSWVRIWICGGPFEHGNEPSGSGAMDLVKERNTWRGGIKLDLIKHIASIQESLIKIQHFKSCVYQE
jgi:hypothetical protein